MKNKKKRGFSLTEIVVALVIISIIGTAGVTLGGKQISSARKKTAVSELKVFGNNMESMLSELGYMTYSEIETDISTSGSEIGKYLTKWDKNYFSAPLGIYTSGTSEGYFAVCESTHASSDKYYFGLDFAGIVVNTRGYEDPWDNEYRIFYLAPKTGTNYRFIIASAGPDGKFYGDDDTTYTTGVSCAYSDGEFDDDIVLVMEPR